MERSGWISNVLSVEQIDKHACPQCQGSVSRLRVATQCPPHTYRGADITKGAQAIGGLSPPGCPRCPALPGKVSMAWDVMLASVRPSTWVVA